MESRRRVLIFLQLAFFLFITNFLRAGIHQASFERFLNTSSITFDDFPPDYANALILSTAAQKPLEYNYSTLPPPSNLSIPRKIHFIFFPNLYGTHSNHLPDSQAPSLCAHHNPTFKLTTWNVSMALSLLETHYPWFLPTYNSYRYPIQRVDAIKYFILYHYGGIYMDLDISCRRPLDPLLGFEAWFPKAMPLGVNNDLMASRTGHPVMERLIKRLEGRNMWLGFPYVTIFWSTGPQFSSDVLREWWLMGRKGEGTVRILPLEFYSEEYTFFGHSPGGTWHGDDVAVMLWLVDRPCVLVLVVFTMLSASVVVARKRGRKR